MGASRWWWFAAAPWAAIGGCSLAFHPDDYYDPNGGLDAAADQIFAREAGSSHDAGRDGNRTDGPADAVGDGGPPDHDARVSSFCEGVVDAAFCQDFDDASSVFQGWTSMQTSVLQMTGPTTMTLDDTIFLSAPQSLNASVEAVDDATYIVDYLEEDLASGWREATVDFDMYVGKVPVRQSGLLVLTFEFVGDVSVGATLSLGAGKVPDSGAMGQLSFVAVTGENPAGPEAGSYYSPWSYSGSDYDTGAWNHVLVDILPATTDGKVVVSINHIVVEEWMNLTFQTDTNSKKYLALKLGLQKTSDYNPAFDIHYDNVVIHFL